MFLSEKAPAGLALGRHCPDMESSLILITDRHKRFNRGAYPGDDCCQTIGPIRSRERKFAASRKGLIVLIEFL